MTTDGVVALIWIVALVIALALTVAVVGMIVRLINAAREINRLLNETLHQQSGLSEIPLPSRSSRRWSPR